MTARIASCTSEHRLGSPPPAQSASAAGQARPDGQLQHVQQLPGRERREIAGGRPFLGGGDRQRLPGPWPRARLPAAALIASISACAGGFFPGLRRGQRGFGLLDLRENLLRLHADGAAQRLELGVLLGVATAGGALGLGRGRLLFRGVLKPGLRLGDDVCLPRSSRCRAARSRAADSNRARRAFHPVDSVRVEGVVDGGAPQRAFGHRAGGDGLVEARLGLLGVCPRAAQAPGGPGVLALGGGDRRVAGSVARASRTRRACRPARRPARSSPASSASQAAIFASHSAIRAARRRARAVAPMYSAWSLRCRPAVTPWE